MNDPSPNHSLCIVIPAWRARHLTAALASLSAQTDRRFRLYIGDDASSDDLRSLVESIGAGMDIVYHRFPENLGGKDLVAHWHRCIALTKNEPWIWLFSDDDIADPLCVASFYKLLDSEPEEATLFRFNTLIINDAGEITRRPPPHPEKETARDLLTAMLTDDSRSWRGPDHIFSRATYVKLGGFVNFPKALYSDHATWILYANEGLVYTIPNACIRFRQYEHGTSTGMLNTYRPEFLVATANYVEFIIATYRRLEPLNLDYYGQLARKRAIRMIFRSPGGISFSEVAQITSSLSKSKNVYWHCYLLIQFYAFRTWLRSLPGFQYFAHLRLRRSRV